jgi:hypothetical protein
MAHLRSVLFNWFSDPHKNETFTGHNLMIIHAQFGFNQAYRFWENIFFYFTIESYCITVLKSQQSLIFDQHKNIQLTEHHYLCTVQV